MEIHESSADLGNKIFIFGVVLQWLSYVAFLALLILTHMKVKKVDPQRLGPATRLVWAMYFSSFFVLVS